MTSLGGVVTVVGDSGRAWRDGTLAETAARLDPRRFVRLDQSHVVNVARLVELLPETHQRYRLRFRDAAGTELVVSRDVGRRLRAALGWRPWAALGSTGALPRVSSPCRPQGPSRRKSVMHARILIVEDDPDIAAIIAMSLNRAGRVVRIARSPSR